MLKLSLWKGLVEVRERSARPMGSILYQVAFEGEMAVSELLNEPARRYVHARWKAWWMMHQDHRSYSEIGRFCNRDHTTVMSGVKRYSLAFVP